MKEKKNTECKGKFDFCWPWYEEFTNGNYSQDGTAKGLAFEQYTNIQTHKPSRNVPYLRYGSKKRDMVVLNYCPWCGASYEKLGRV